MRTYHYKLIDDVMDNFDFEKVHQAMKALNWKWVTDDACFEIPDVITLRTRARQLMKEAITESVEKYDNGGVTIGTGGFEVFYNEDDKYLELKFIVSAWNAYIDDDGSIMSA